MRFAYASCLILLAAFAGAGSAADQATLGPARFVSVLPPAPDQPEAVIKRFRLDRTPVTNAQFLAFVEKQPKWRRDRVARLFADAQYLSHWRGPVELGHTAQPSQPVTHISWFAAKAYCEARNARLPTWYEWEYAAAADEKSPDARRDPIWRQRILSWYAETSSQALAAVAQSPANYYGVHDLHGLVWEWVLDFNALLVSNDSREQGGGDRSRFCGEGALNMADRENYAVLMRIAFLSSLQANNTTKNLGFRCVTETLR
jgi:formylglycine-generating enzyme required for sulfatase activity